MTYDLCPICCNQLYDDDGISTPGTRGGGGSNLEWKAFFSPILLTHFNYFDWYCLLE